MGDKKKATAVADPLEAHFEYWHNNPPVPFAWEGKTAEEIAAIKARAELRDKVMDAIHAKLQAEGVPYQGATEEEQEAYRAEFRRRLAIIRELIG